MNVSLNKYTVSILFAIVSFLVFLVYFPGLSGGFMLDDFSSLPSLFTSINECGWWCGVLSGSTGPTGRPLSLISFAWQANAWPNPYYFKLVNVAIHVVNCILLVLIFNRIICRINRNLPALYISLVAGFVWAVWPLQVSSVLYVVQRMVLLSSFFVLSGIWFYLELRIRLENQWQAQLNKWLLLVLGIGVAGISAVFSKESGVLLLVYLLLLERFLFSADSSNDPYIKYFRWSCLYLPLTIFAVYTTYNYVGSAERFYLLREFSLEERLLTQGRVITDYLQFLFFPKGSALGLYHEAYPKSVSLFEPISTLFGWGVICALIFAAWLLRHKFKLVSLAIFWFFGGHLLEGTILPLELYFEHRNYLPIAVISLLLVYLLYSLFGKASAVYVKCIFMLMSFFYLLMLLFVSYSQTKLWGNPIEYAAVQATEHKDSVRARTLMVDVYNRLGKVDLAYEQVQLMRQDFPEVSGMITSSVEFACYDSKYPLDPVEVVADKLETAKFGFGAILTINDTLAEISEGRCTVVSVDYLLALIKALQINPIYASKMNLLYGYEASAYFMLGQLEKSAEVYSKFHLSPEQWPVYIGVLATLGRIAEAIDVADKALDSLKLKPQYSIYADDVLRLRSVLQAELRVSSEA
jgi:tetratricopeptide (TPR) repeat protein